jgi:hypothetical protein
VGAIDRAKRGRKISKCSVSRGTDVNGFELWLIFAAALALAAVALHAFVFLARRLPAACFGFSDGGGQTFAGRPFGLRARGRDGAVAI